MSATDPARVFDGLASRVDALGFRSVAFTSALLGEGVSTIALGTALSLARLRQEPVLLVDANWLQPALSADAHRESSPGLADHLAAKSDLAGAVVQLAPAQLAFLPIGDRAAARPTLRSLASFLAVEAAAYKTVVIDLPPVLAGESFVLPWAALVDQLFVVLREAATPLPLVRDALGRIGLTSARIVLNRATASYANVPAKLEVVRT
jgi:polysaccharide biosynthesis transport protein